MQIKLNYVTVQKNEYFFLEIRSTSQRLWNAIFFYKAQRNYIAFSQVSSISKFILFIDAF